ncbi:MAG: hypothetical protein N2746_07125 [Deltaproteobacteria bacterium]|nr:hypothetical protein [Deltaproteobacteria bacterium]
MRFYLFVSLLIVFAFNIEVNSEEIRLKGDRLRIYEKEHRYLIDGNVVVEGDTFVFFSDSLEIFETGDKSVINGNLIFLDDSILVSCGKVEMLKNLKVRRFFNLRGYVLKISINPKDYLGYEGDKLDQILGYKIRLSALYLKQVEDDKIFAEDVKYTLCKCKNDNTWELSADSVYYEKDKFLLSLSNVVYFYNIPSFYIPAILVPVGERRSGFLFPEMGFNSTTGYSLRNAYYQTLGVSADATLYFTIMSRKEEMYSLEFRYRPLENLYGKMMLSYLDAKEDSVYDKRFNLKNNHRYEYSDSILLGMTTNLVSDSTYMFDFLFDFWERNTEYTISRFYSGYIQDNILLNLYCDFYQNFKQGLKPGSFNLFSDVGLSESQRLPSLTFTLLPQYLIANTDFMVDVNYVNYYSFSYDYKKVDYVGRPLIVDDERRRVLSFQRFSLDFPLHHYYQLLGAIDLNQRLNLSYKRYQLPATSYNTTTSLYSLVFDIDLFKDYAKFVHLIRPSIEYKNLFFLEYTKDNELYQGRLVVKDEKDNYLKSQYAVLHLKNFFHMRKGGVSREVFYFDISQGYQEIGRKELTPLIISSDIQMGYFNILGDLFYYWGHSDPYIDSTVELSLSDKRGDSVVLKYQKIKNYLKNPYIIFNEEFEYFFPADYRNGLSDVFTSINISVFRELSMVYFITYSFEKELLLYHGGGVYYRSKCNCLNMAMTFLMFDWYEFPSLMMSFTLGNDIL